VAGLWSLVGLIVPGAGGGWERREGHRWGRDTQIVFLPIVFVCVRRGGGQWGREGRESCS